MKKLTREQLVKLSQELVTTILADEKKRVNKVVELTPNLENIIYIHQIKERDEELIYHISVDYIARPHWQDEEHDDDNTGCGCGGFYGFSVTKANECEELLKEITNYLEMIQEDCEYYFLCQKVALLEMFEEKVPEKLLEDIRAYEYVNGRRIQNTLTDYEEENE